MPRASHRANQIAANQRQHKASRPLIPEYSRIQLLQKDQQDPTADFKLLETLTQTGAHDRDRENGFDRRVGIYHTKKEFFDKSLLLKHPCNSIDSVGAHDRDRENGFDRRVGIYHTKKEFFDKSLLLKHPCNSIDSVTPLTKEIVTEVLQSGFTFVASKRIKAMVMIKKTEE